MACRFPIPDLLLTWPSLHPPPLRSGFPSPRPYSPCPRACHAGSVARTRSHRASSQLPSATGPRPEDQGHQISAFLLPFSYLIESRTTTTSSLTYCSSPPLSPSYSQVLQEVREVIKKTKRRVMGTRRKRRVAAGKDPLPPKKKKKKSFFL